MNENMNYDVNEHREDGISFTAVYAVVDELNNTLRHVEVKFINAYEMDARMYARENTGLGEYWNIDSIL